MVRRQHMPARRIRVFGVHSSTADHLLSLTLPCLLQAARILANLLVAGGGVLFRAAAQAYRQAVVSKQHSLCCGSESVRVLLTPLSGRQPLSVQHGSLSMTVWRPFCADAAKSGVAAENVSAGLKSGQMSVQEAQQILGVEKNATLEQARKVRSHWQGIFGMLHVVDSCTCTLAHGC